MNHQDSIIPTTQSVIKAYKCETCETTYSDKVYYDLHRQSHQKDIPGVVQIVVGNNHQTTIPHTNLQPSPAHQQIIIQDEQQLAAFKRAYGVETQQVYALAAPTTQFQVIAGNSRGNVSVGNQLTYSTPQFTPTYVVAGTINEHCQLQPIQDQSMLQAHHIQLSDIIPGASLIPHENHMEVQVQQAPVNVNRSTPTKVNRNVGPGTNERPYKCDQCTASFIEETELEEHRKKHTGDGPFTCEDCHFTFMYKTHFRSHKSRCQKKRAGMSQTAKPVILNSEIVKRTFPTNATEQQLSTKQHVQQHLLPSNMIPGVKTFAINQKESLIKSTFAPKSRQTASHRFNPTNPSFKTFKKVKRESRLDRPYECDECDASFQSDVDLRTHKTKHTGEGPFKCEECRFVFLYRKLFEAHRRRCEKKRGKGVVVSSSMETVLQNADPSDHELHNVVMSNANDSTIEENRLHMQPCNMESHDVSIANSTQLNIPVGQSVIEMRPINNHSSVSELNPQHHQVLEQVVLGSGNAQIKYDVVSAEGMDVNQILNLIKSKGRYTTQ